MEKIYTIGQKLFFDILIICIVSYIFFETVVSNTMTTIIGFAFMVGYFGAYFYTGYKHNLNVREAIIVGIIGCALAIFLGIFAIYVQFILKMPGFATWLTMPYFMPTMSIIKVFSLQITTFYCVKLVVINILLVIIGSFSKKIMNKLSL